MLSLKNFLSILTMHLFNKSYRNILISNIFFWIFSRIGKIFLIEECSIDQPANFLRKIFTKKFYLYAYQASFSRLKIFEAFRYRILSINLILKHGSASQRVAALNYLNIFYNCDLIDQLDISLKTKKFLLDCLQSHKKSSMNNYKPICNEISDVAIIGPKFDFTSMDLRTYKYIIATKPPPDEVLTSCDSRFIIFPGPIWSRSNTSKINMYQRNFKNIEFSYFWGIQNGSLIKYMNENFHFPFGAWLMNLQRLLIFSKYSFPNSRIYVDGFDFFLSNNTWSAWYQKNLVTPKSSNPLWSIMKHDYLVSLIFSKDFFKQNKNFSGPTVEITRKDIQEIISIFIDTHEARKFFKN